LDDPALWQFFEPISVPESVSELSICANGDHRPVTLEEVIAIKKASK
jgi:hypothetical protein